MGMTLTQYAQYITTTCIKCGVVIPVEAEHNKALLQSRETFYCINGHPQCYTAGQGEVDKLKRELAAEKLKRETAENEAKWQKEQREQLSKKHEQLSKKHDRYKKRVSNGVCPCCNRTFGNLQRHMKTKHPDHVT